jgi:hypothetical protein
MDLARALACCGAMRRSLFAVSAMLLALAGCGDSRQADSMPFSNGSGSMEGVADDARTRAAERAMADLDAALQAIRQLPPAEALERQRALGPQVHAAVASSAGTRHENRAVYLEAQWSFNFNDDGAGVDAALDRLDRLERPLLKVSGRMLRVQHLLRQDRRSEARALATRLVNDVPQFSFLIDMVEWHEHIGNAVERTGGFGLDGQAVDPGTGTDRWLLYLHLGTWNDQSAFTVQRFQTAIGAADCRLVVVVRDGSARRITADLQPVPGAERRTVLFCRSSAEAAAMLASWHVPLDGWTVLLDRDRRVSRVDLRPSELPALIAQ